MTEAERDEAHERILGEEVRGATITLADGTVIQGGVVVQAGPRAIVGEDGKLSGLKPE